MLQDLLHRAQSIDTLFEHTLRETGFPFLKAQWQLAKAEHAEPLDAISAYLNAGKIEFHIVNNVQQAELNRLSDSALCFLPNGQIQTAKQLKNTNAPFFPIDTVLTVSQDNATNTIKPTLGLVEFWLKLSRSEWLKNALKQGFPSLKPVIYASILINVLALATPFFSIQVYDRIIPNQAYTSLWALVSGVFLCLWFDHLLKHARHRLMEYAATITDTECTKQLSQTLMQTSPNNADPGFLLQHLRSFESIREIITGMFLLTLIDLPFLLLFLVVIAVINPLFLLITATVIALTMGSVIRTHRKISRLGAMQVNEYRTSQSQWLDSIQNLDGLQAHGVQEAYAGSLNKRQLSSRLSGNLVREIIFSSNQTVHLLQQLSWVGIIVLGVYLIVDQSLTMGGLIAVSMLSMRCFAPLSKLQSHLIQSHAAQAGFEDLDQFLSISNQKRTGKEPLLQIDTIELNKASALKPGRPAHSKIQSDYLLSHFSMNIQRGAKIGIVGPTGSGKTSLLRLLAKQVELTEGQYRINHLDASHFNAAELGQHIGFAPQPPMILKGTLKDNLTLKRPWVTVADCWLAAETLGLSDWIKSHPDGLNMPIESGGGNLSSGQRQLLGLARAMAGKPSLLLLDEPTVCLDHQAEERLIATLKNLSSEVTLLFTTHRVNLLACANQMALINKGTLSAFGDKNSVMQMAKTLNDQANPKIQQGQNE